MFEGKPIIGLSGGIGSGKSFVAKLFGDAGCAVIGSDELVRSAYNDSRVKQQVKRWWGPMVFSPDGEIDRSAVSRKIFGSTEERRRLEGLLHPIVDKTRQRMMQSAAADSRILAYVWDTPLLFETELNLRCDATVFVDVPREVRLKRVMDRRGWDADELNRRENSQLPLDKKRAISDYVIVNTADETSARGQVRELLTRILSDQKTLRSEHLA